MITINLIVALILLLVVSCCCQGQKVTWVSTTNSERWVQHKNMIVVQDDGTTVNPVTIDSGTTYQTIDGFGGCFNEKGWVALQQLSLKDRKAVLKALFDLKDGCKFNICRMPIGASDYALDYYSLDDTKDDYAMEHFNIKRDQGCLIPYIKAAMQYNPQLKVWGSPWTPPAWMKVSNFYKAAEGNNRSNVLRWEPQVLAAYALYFEKFVKAYQAEGINLYAIHVQNEPYANQQFPSCLWSAAQMRDFIRDYLGPRFKNDNIQAEIWLGTINNGNAQRTTLLVLADEQARAFITGCGFQWGGKDAIGLTHAQYPETKLMQTENECGDGKNDWTVGMYTFGLMTKYFTNYANSYLYWNMVLDETGMSSWNWKQNAMVTVDTINKKVIFNPEFYVMKHFSAFVAPGAVRVKLTGADGLAFRNPDGKLVLVTANKTDNSSAFNLKIDGRILQCTLPAQSVNTIVYGMT